jgi:serine/threonine protein kinase
MSSKAKTKSKPEYSFDPGEDSEEDEPKTYMSAFISNLTIDKEEKTVKPTEVRIDYIKTIIDNTQLKPLIDFENCNTEIAEDYRINKKILDLAEVFDQIGAHISYVKSGSTGHVFKAYDPKTKNPLFAVKVCAYSKVDKYGEMNNISRPENAELRVLKLLSYFVVNKKTPHIVLPFATFNTSIKYFVNIEQKKTGNREKDAKRNELYNSFVQRYKNNEFDDFVSVLLTEWANSGDLLEYIRRNYVSMTLEDWTMIFFQIFYTLCMIHNKYPNFKHNDLKANNILINTRDVSPNGKRDYYKYKINGEDIFFLVPKNKMEIKIWDFDFACIGGIIENNKVNSKWTNKMNINNERNQYYDIHFFINTLINKNFFSKFFDAAPEEIIQFVNRVVPEKYRSGNAKYVNEKGRIQVNDEFTTPRKILLTDPLFEKYRIKNK